MTGNYMYDVKRKESFLIGSNSEQLHSYWWDSGEPLWVTAVKQASGIMIFNYQLINLVSSLALIIAT